MTAAVPLAGLALALAWPVPTMLAGAAWTRRAPRAALVLWQAVGLAGGLAGIGAGLALGVAPLGRDPLAGVRVLAEQLLAGRPPAGLGPLNLLGLAWALLVGGWLSAALACSLAVTLRSRACHRRMVDLVAHPHPAVPDPAARVLDHPAAVAYCLPGVLHPRVVLSVGVLTLLSGRELACVLAHERVHLHARHDLVVLPFAALAAALHWLPWPRQARDAVAALVEMLADDQACRGHDRRVLAAALVRVGTAGRLPAGALPAGEHAVVARVRRLLEPAAPPPAWVPGVYLLAAVVLASPAVLLAAPAMTAG
jgi:Zn-dependent protease with chaperone function